MTDEPNTEAAKILDGAESAVGDLLASLRLPADNNTTVTVLDWLDTHGVLDAVDDAAHKIAADAEAASADAEAAKASAVDGAGVASTPVGEGDPLASGTTPAGVLPNPVGDPDPSAADLAKTQPPAPATEATASDAQRILDTAEAKVEAAGTDVEKDVETEARHVAPEVKAGLTDALHNVLSWVEKL